MTESGKPVDTLGYEEARGELIEVVQQLEQGGLDLDTSLALWERGEALAKRCEEHLAGARKRIEDALDSDQPRGSSSVTACLTRRHTADWTGSTLLSWPSIWR